MEIPSSSTATEHETNGEQIAERQFRDDVSTQWLQWDESRLLGLVSHHHSVPLMSHRAGELRKRLRSEDFIIDLGTGFGWQWKKTTAGAAVVGVDFSINHLRIAKRLLKRENRVFLVCASAAALPFRAGTFRALWSVQVFQHFPPNTLRETALELQRVLQDNVMVEVHDLNPSLLWKLRRFLGGAQTMSDGNVSLEKRTPAQLCELWQKIVTHQNRVRIGYSEIFFQPGLNLRPKRYPVKFEIWLNKLKPLAGLVARQTIVRIDAARS